ncbi:MAG: alpha/beta fold hydrolase [Dermatophilaceae bacterium]
MHDLSGPGSPRDAPVVLAAHGITANGYWWLPLARELVRRGSRVRLLAACLRGRADSLEVGGPYGLAAHAADLVEIAQRLRVRALLLGHSMGGFVATLAIARRPECFAGALLVDGGVSVPAPAGTDPLVVAGTVLRPALVRVRMRFPDEDAYVASWARHPALRPLMAADDDGLLRRVALHDALQSTDRDGVAVTAIRQAVAPEAILQDGRDVATDPQAAVAVQRGLEHGLPVGLVWARRGLFDQPQGVYDEAGLASAAPRGLRTTCVEDANHLSVVLASPGVAVIADSLERLLAL